MFIVCGTDFQYDDEGFDAIYSTDDSVLLGVPVAVHDTKEDAVQDMWVRERAEWRQYNDEVHGLALGQFVPFESIDDSVRESYAALIGVPVEDVVFGKAFKLPQDIHEYKLHRIIEVLNDGRPLFFSVYEMRDIPAPEPV